MSKQEVNLVRTMARVKVVDRLVALKKEIDPSGGVEYVAANPTDIVDEWASREIKKLASSMSSKENDQRFIDCMDQCFVDACNATDIELASLLSDYVDMNGLLKVISLVDVSKVVANRLIEERSKEIKIPPVSSSPSSQVEKSSEEKFNDSLRNLQVVACSKNRRISSADLNMMLGLVNEQNVNQATLDGWTPLHFVAMFGTSHNANDLIAKGAGINVFTTGEYRCSVLSAAISGEGNRQDIVKGLLVLKPSFEQIKCGLCTAIALGKEHFVKIIFDDANVKKQCRDLDVAGQKSFFEEVRGALKGREKVVKERKDKRGEEVVGRVKRLISEFEKIPKPVVASSRYSKRKGGSSSNVSYRDGDDDSEGHTDILSVASTSSSEVADNSQNTNNPMKREVVVSRSDADDIDLQDIHLDSLNPHASEFVPSGALAKQQEQVSESIAVDDDEEHDAQYFDGLMREVNAWWEKVMKEEQVKEEQVQQPEPAATTSSASGVSIVPNTQKTVGHFE